MIATENREIMVKRQKRSVSGLSGQQSVRPEKQSSVDIELSIGLFDNRSQEVATAEKQGESEHCPVDLRLSRCVRIGIAENRPPCNPGLDCIGISLHSVLKSSLHLAVAVYLTFFFGLHHTLAQAYLPSPILNRGAVVDLLVSAEDTTTPWVIAADRYSVDWSVDDGKTWSSHVFGVADALITAIVISDSLSLISHERLGIFAAKLRGNGLTPVPTPPYGWSHSISRVGGDTLVASGVFGVSRSVDMGRNWSQIDSLFSEDWPPVTSRVVSLSEGHVIVFSQINGFEPIEYRLFDSWDAGETWPTRGQEIRLPWSGNPILGVYETASHAQIVVQSQLLHIRKTSTGAVEHFDVGDHNVPRATSYSQGYGILGVGAQGLVVLDEVAKRWVLVDSTMIGNSIAVGAGGNVYTAYQGTVYKWTRVVSDAKELSVSGGQQSALYPNPAADTVNIDSPVALDRYSIFDLLGRVWMTGNLNGTGPKYSIQTSQLSPGAYIVEVKDGHSRSAYKMLVISR